MSVGQSLGVDAAPHNTVMVRTMLNRPGVGVDIYFDYRLVERPVGYRIIDVFSPRDISEVGMRRAEYHSILQNSDFDTLIERMEALIARRRER